MYEFVLSSLHCFDYSCQSCRLFIPRCILAPFSFNRLLFSSCSVLCKWFFFIKSGFFYSSLFISLCSILLWEFTQNCRVLCVGRDIRDNLVLSPMPWKAICNEHHHGLHSFMPFLAAIKLS